ncbi:MAG: hypothetical protein LBI99_03725 [Propionibacteriaceae bacterium]|jgi:hypothetical protein|nr:hypothetical protein [Propionibacteriaceae bacterium]
MTPVASKLRFYVDESALGLGKALTIARTDTIHCGHMLIPECELGIHDEDWIPIVAGKGLVAIARDKKIRSKPVEKQAIKNSSLRGFLIGGKEDMSTWGWLKRFVGQWDAIEQVISEHPEGPWLYSINKYGVSEVVLD